MINIHKVTLSGKTRIDTLLNTFKYLNLNYPGARLLIYGSSIEMTYEPSDIDVMVIGSSTASSQTVIDIPEVDFPIDIQFLTEAEYNSKRDNLDMALLSYWYCTPHGMVNITEEESGRLFSANPAKTREAVSKASSAAWAKGHKKLTVQEDYNEVLGIKNIIHSIKFPMRAVEIMIIKSLIDALSDNSYDISKTQRLMDYMKESNETIKYLRERSDDIYSSFGSASDKWERFKSVAKPVYNAEMTKFRQYFPKEA